MTRTALLRCGEGPRPALPGGESFGGIRGAIAGAVRRRRRRPGLRGPGGSAPGPAAAYLPRPPGRRGRRRGGVPGDGRRPRRRAGSIRDRDAVGSWLHRVACRVARRHRAQVARRRAASGGPSRCGGSPHPDPTPTRSSATRCGRCCTTRSTACRTGTGGR